MYEGSEVLRIAPAAIAVKKNCFFSILDDKLDFVRHKNMEHKTGLKVLCKVTRHLAILSLYVKFSIIFYYI